ncbi:hypothetical protein Pcinc_035533 [Petrolisthes cinctipes]|uniref:Uncharacterized protein n=1 Tax=Petrolisthes cinctipes TaxID=88211 RepID=A0AAE1EPU7_PETCI|nr:hypothetical protein Pcinc_035533 [Petrolisthes cinctipes]
MEMSDCVRGRAWRGGMERKRRKTRGRAELGRVGVMGVRVMDVDDKRRPPPTSVTGEGRGEERDGGKEG